MHFTVLQGALQRKNPVTVPPHYKTRNRVCEKNM